MIRTLEKLSSGGNSSFLEKLAARRPRMGSTMAWLSAPKEDVRKGIMAHAAKQARLPKAQRTKGFVTFRGAKRALQGGAT